MERKPFKGPDLTAPRNREQVKDFLSYPDKDLYCFFARMKQQHPQLEKYSNRELAKCIEIYNQSLANEVVTESWHGVMLPEDLGFVIVSACEVPEETVRKNIDFNASKRLGFIVPHLNIHSCDKVAKINYYNDIPWHRFKNHHLWKFKPCRKLQRAVSGLFKDGRQNWCKRFSKPLRVADLFRKPKYLKSA